MQRRDRLDLRIDLDAGADAEAPSDRPSPVRWSSSSTFARERALELLRVRALEADRDVRDRHDAVEVDEDGNEPLLLLGVAECALEQTRLAVFPRSEEANVVTADRGTEELVRLVVAVEELLRGDRARVDEGVRVDDHVRCQRTRKYADSGLTPHLARYRRRAERLPARAARARMRR